MKVIKAFLGAALFAASSLASASPIFYEVEELDSDENRWRYNYTVGNETGADIDWFTIWFDPALFAFDTVDFGDGDEVDPDAYQGAPEWDVLVGAPDPLFPDDPSDDQWGFYDAFAFGDPVAPGSLVSGFSMIFTWLGDGTPGSQPFTLYGDDLLADISSNLFTERLGGDPVSVPEPGTLGLLGASIALLGVGRRRPAKA